MDLTDVKLVDHVPKVLQYLAKAKSPLYPFLGLYRCMHLPFVQQYGQIKSPMEVCPSSYCAAKIAFEVDGVSNATDGGVRTATRNLPLVLIICGLRCNSSKFAMIFNVMAGLR